MHHCFALKVERKYFFHYKIDIRSINQHIGIHKYTLLH